MIASQILSTVDWQKGLSAYIIYIFNSKYDTTNHYKLYPKSNTTERRRIGKGKFTLSIQIMLFCCLYSNSKLDVKSKAPYPSHKSYVETWGITVGKWECKQLDDKCVVKLRLGTMVLYNRNTSISMAILLSK